MPLLSCEQCRRRKTKCDKGAPCSACRSAGISCHVVQRDRLPRGRSGKVRRGDSKDAVLEERVERIEKLLKTVVSDSKNVSNGHDFSPAVGGDAKLASPPTRVRPVGLDGDFIATDFWTALSQEVAGIRETIEDPDPEDDSSHSLSTPSTDTSLNSALSNHILSTPVLLANNQSTPELPRLPEQIREHLLDIYGFRVDSVLKIGHWPTIRSGLQSLYEVHGARTAKPSRKALELTIYFTAVCSMTPDECRSKFLADRATLVTEYRASAETALFGVRLLQKPELDDLRALVIYLQGIRILGAYATSWTLLSVAVRIAYALGLDSEYSNSMSRFDIECRRRLWYSICLADTQATLDRGSMPLVPAEAVGTTPLNINDDKMSARSMPISSHSGWTDMSCFIMTAEAMLCQKRICAIDSWDGFRWSGWAKKLTIVEDFQRSMETRYMSVDTETATPLQLLTTFSAQSIAATMHLLLRRPPYRQQNHLVPPWDDFGILEGATTVLEQNLAKGMDTRLTPWMWKKWPPWYALAVALAELCRMPMGALADKAYKASVKMHRRYAAPLDDPESGMLWRPITKLLKKVTHLRTQILNDSKVVVNNGPREAGGSVFSYATLDAPTPVADNQISLKPSLDMSAKSELPDALTFDGMEDIAWLDSLPELNPESGVSWLSWDLVLQDAGDPSPFA